VTPPVEGNRPSSFSVQVSLRRGMSVEDGGTFTTQVQFSDQRPPNCQFSVSPLSLRVDCDETIVDAGVAIPGRPHTVVMARQGARALFDAPDVGPTGNAQRGEMREADAIIRPAIGDRSAIDFGAREWVMAEGEKATRARLPAILQAIADWSPKT
jgi:hypothetical protein